MAVILLISIVNTVDSLRMDALSSVSSQLVLNLAFAPRRGSEWYTCSK
jgi:hypothetical protein